MEFGSRVFVVFLLPLAQAIFSKWDRRSTLRVFFVFDNHVIPFLTVDGCFLLSESHFFFSYGSSKPNVI